MKPLCVAARTAVLIDPDKSVRPCCSYTNWGKHIPNSNGIAILSEENKLRDIKNGEVWQGVVRELDARKIPEGCKVCMDRERDNGYAMRRFYDSENWDKGLTFLELNTSNLCTLQCRHCGPFCSHRWANEYGLPVFKPDNELLLSSMRQMDLSHLERIVFKGGEPLMNSDVTVALQHLESIGRLRDVFVLFVTNGTIINEPLMELLKKAKRVQMTLSVDGVGDVQTYIRHGKSEVENIEHFIAQSVTISKSNILFSPLPSIMAYNIFSLDAIADWWSKLMKKYPTNTTPMSFHHFVVDPAYLSVQSLRDETRKRLLAKYERLEPALYENVMRTLRLPYAGDQQHAQLVAETLKNDKVLGRSVFDAIPEMASEMVA